MLWKKQAACQCLLLTKKENYRDFLQSTGNTNTDEED